MVIALLVFSAITEKEELICSEVKLLQGMSERLKERAMYRSQNVIGLDTESQGLITGKDTIIG